MIIPASAGGFWHIFMILGGKGAFSLSCRFTYHIMPYRVASHGRLAGRAKSQPILGVEFVRIMLRHVAGKGWRNGTLVKPHAEFVRVRPRIYERVRETRPALRKSGADPSRIGRNGLPGQPHRAKRRGSFCTHFTPSRGHLAPSPHHVAGKAAAVPISKAQR
jgi:hypothetical protein